MAKKRTPAKARRTSTRRSSLAKSAFKSFALHATEAAGQRTFSALEAERPGIAAFALPTDQPANLDPESAAKRILQHALASATVPSFTAPKVGGDESEFKSIGVETVPLMGTTVVKFRQQVNDIPVYGSLVSVELGDNNECISLNSNMATPDVKSHVAKISPQEALKKAAERAGYGRELPNVTPMLNYYLDAKGKWHLAYIMEDVRIRERAGGRGKVASGSGHPAPFVYDYVVDAISGSMVAELPRTPTMAAGTDQATDERGKLQSFNIDVDGTKKTLRDLTLNIETYDFNFADPQIQAGKLPGKIVVPPWSSAAVSAHCNAAVVASFLRQVLRRNNIDNQGGRLISIVNCVLKRDEQPPGSKRWLNAFWDGTQMVYGQAEFAGKLRSLSSSLAVVAHELFHGVTGSTARLVYLNETGALNESYSDIFGIIIANAAEPDIGKWSWLIGDGISSGLDAFRDFQDPTKFNQPKHMRKFVRTSRDSGGVHINSGIHNFAAYNIFTTQQDGAYLFQPAELAAIFYVALTQSLSRQSTFADSRRAVLLATRTLFRQRPEAELAARVAAVEKGFDDAGIA
jgi:Zn-dependent metalloprotease